MVINFQNVSFRYTDKLLLNEVNFSLDENSKVGLMGRNGEGKSTILKLIAGLEKPTGGVINISGNLKIAYLEQNQQFPKNKTIFELATSKSSKEHPLPEYEVKGILNNLKLFDHNKVADNLSGGEQKRLSLAITLLSECDIYLLDEPTNHLDSDTILFLEKYLMKTKKGILLVTHDRYFLERICNKMFELDRAKIYTYVANYSLYLSLKEQRLENEAHVEAKIKSVLRNELKWIRAGAQARSTKQKSRIERFNKLSETEFKKDSSLQMVSLNSRLGNDTIEIEHISKSIEGKTLFNDFSFSLLRNARVAVVGENGCGKSTLFKIIMGLTKPDTGNVKIGQTVKIGYFSQINDTWEEDDRAIDYIHEGGTVIKTNDGEMTASAIMEMFLFDKEKQYSKIKTFSGGEKRRLQLLKVILSNPNILILDEPTNDLDIVTLEILEEYIDKFLGPVLFVSHDRYFVDKVSDTLLCFENGKINEKICSLSEYLASTEVKEEKVVKTVERKPNISSAKIKTKLENIEKKLTELKQKISQLDQEIEEKAEDYMLIGKLADQKDLLEEEVDNLELEYLENLDILESIKK